MKSSRLKPLIFLAIPLAVGGLAALFSAGSMDKFSALNQPPLSPPGWLFPIVWGILYILMGTASYIVYSSDAPEISKQKALGLYLVQLGFNFLWPILFFTFGLCTAAAVLIVILWVLILLTLLYFYRTAMPKKYTAGFSLYMFLCLRKKRYNCTFREHYFFQHINPPIAINRFQQKPRRR